MKKELHLVLGFDTSDEKLQAIMQKIVVKSARLMYANALIAHAASNDGSTKPDIHLYSDDFLMGKEDIGVPPAAAGASEVASSEATTQVPDKSTGNGNQFGDEEEAPPG